MDLPVRRFCNVVYWWATQRVKDADRFKYDLDRPLPGRAKRVTEETAAEEMAAFRAFAGALNAGS